LVKLGMEDWFQWGVAAVCFGVTVAVQAEIALLFLGAAMVGIAWYGSLFRGRGGSWLALLAVTPVPAEAVRVAGGSSLAKLFVFFLKAGSLTFGSGLVIVPFLEKGLVQQTGWIDERQFLVAVAIGMISPGPVVITATFVGYLVGGFWGALVATVGIFLPSFLLVLAAAPLLRRYGADPNVRGFVKGAYGAAIGTIFGASVLLGRIAIGDWLTALVAFGSLVALSYWKLPSAALVAASAVIGLIAFPLLMPSWVFLR
jgi:chromate transporter